jgi:hypothetical protein
MLKIKVNFGLQTILSLKSFKIDNAYRFVSFYHVATIVFLFSRYFSVAITNTYALYDMQTYTQQSFDSLTNFIQSKRCK